MLTINNKSRIFILWVTAIIATIGLTGCVKAEISVDVKQNGSGTLSIAIGMTQQAKALASNQGSDPIQEMKKGFAESTGEAQDVKVTTWIDGDYEWAKAGKDFGSIDEISKLLNDNKLFNNFSLTRKRGIFRDEFTLDGELAPIDNNTSSGDNLNIDPSALIQVSFSARLPGKITETNGVRDLNDPNRIVWNIQSKQSVLIRAKSTTWNWINIFVMSGCLLLLGVVAIGGLVYFLYLPSRKNKELDKSQSIENLPIQEAAYIAELGIEKLLLEINTKVLNGVGQIHERQEGITLIWKDASHQERKIDIKKWNDDQISINDRIHSATKQDTRAGIIDALRIQVKSNRHTNST